MLEHAGVSEGTVQDIVGHQRSTLTGSTYSGKGTLEMRRDALAKLPEAPASLLPRVSERRLRFQPALGPRQQTRMVMSPTH